jgi:aminopeptidase N
MRKLLLTFSFIYVFIALNAQSKIDVLHYSFVIKLSDSNDKITGIAQIKFVALDTISSASFDLAELNNEKKGMIVQDVLLTLGINSHATPVVPDELSFKHEGDKLLIALKKLMQKSDTATIAIIYHGIPADGLIISKNKYGRRTFFSDNWPDRAHNWIPCVDDPADKASVEFVINAPSHYKVISNGTLIKSESFDKITITHWKEDMPLPTKIMVIGVADFAVDTPGYVNNIPVTSWVFPENKKDGFYDYAQAKDILSFFINYIGPYPYKKLANVQSKTIFGGMENASAIFYSENSVTGNRKEESLIAHEIPHQWFGDMVTEKNFAHLWLSEGFATYLAHIYLESNYGTDSLNAEMKKDRKLIIDFTKGYRRPVVDSVSPYMSLLNANSYQKGRWILHMLRRQLGDSVFHKIIRNYYAAYAGKNADTKDFQRICEKVSGKNLETFFTQWLYTAANPKLEVQWKYNEKDKTILLTVKQLQNSLFEFPLEIQIQTASGKSQVETLSITKQSQQFNIPVKEKIVQIYLDPKTSLLFEGFVSAIK